MPDRCIYSWIDSRIDRMGDRRVMGWGGGSFSVWTDGLGLNKAHNFPDSQSPYNNLTTVAAIPKSPSFLGDSYSAPTI